ncbi:MAG: hypothetical protein KDC44_15125 [Phaeodactylibacter sp.]|nr:hypothetical protein [Phaeodactylibacter sp.]
MADKSALSKAQALIEEDRIGEAIRLLQEKVGSSPALSQLAARLRDFERQNIAGILDSKEAQQFKNKISWDLLQHIRTLHTEPAATTVSSSIPKPTNDMSNKKQVRLSIFIALMGVLIGFLGELMPDELKAQIQTAVTDKLGMNYTQFWIILAVLFVGTSLFFVWRDARSDRAGQPGRQSPQAGQRTIHQHGDKSIYIERNKGDININ